MSIKASDIEVNNFDLFSSGDVSDVVRKLSLLHKRSTLIHISAFIHNTVLAQNLKKEISKAVPSAKIVSLKHQDKNKTSVAIFTTNDNLQSEDISDVVLRELNLESWDKEISIKEYRNQLFKRYFTDHLTNLPNQYQLRKDLQANEDFGLILVKVDNFQTINSFYGFVVGDYVIEHVGSYLKENLKEHQVYRLSGAEFALTLEKSLGFYDLKNYLNELYSRIRDISILYQETKIFIDFTLSSSANTDGANIFSKVSMALKYAQKTSVPFWIYEDRMEFENEYERNLQLSSIVREAVEDGRIVPYFQSIVDIKTSKVVRYECLARLIDSNGKILSPFRFIPVAKKIKVYSTVTKLIIDKAFETFEDSEYEFSINISGEDIMNTKVFNYIISKLKTSKASSRVSFELLESEAIQDFKKVERFINEAKRYGAKIAIDDFGSGYSNFAYLTKMKIDYIKIDGTLIKNIDVDKPSLLVVETIVDFAKKLGVKTIAEYVYSSVIMDKVKDLGIDYAQGFYIDEPKIDIEK
ncbi:MAG: GGDEF domain-containing phosphodiesterase [Campylobacterota bacterium]|nr:GGDEF domain-containing phosphodiesterase [Campylobacterota bacterium]